MRPYVTYHEDRNTALRYGMTPAGEVLAGTLVGQVPKDFSPGFNATQSKGAFHVTLSVSGGKAYRLADWRRIVQGYMMLAGVSPYCAPWVAFRQGGIKNDHIHLVIGDHTFTGRKIDLRLSQAKTNEVQVALAKHLKMSTPRLFKPKQGVGGSLVSLREKGRAPGVRLLVEAIREAFSGWPTSFEQFATQLKLLPGGFSVEQNPNRRGKLSALFKGPNIAPIRGGDISMELEPRHLKARFALFRSLHILRDRIAEILLVTAQKSAFLPIQTKGTSQNGKQRSPNPNCPPRTSEQRHSGSEVTQNTLNGHQQYSASAYQAAGPNRGGLRSGTRQQERWGADPFPYSADPEFGGSPRPHPDRNQRKAGSADQTDGAANPDAARNGARVGSLGSISLGLKMLTISRIARSYFAGPILRAKADGRILVYVEGEPMAVWQDGGGMRTRPADAEHRRFAEEVNRALGFPLEPKKGGRELKQGGVIEVGVISDNLPDAQPSDDIEQDDGGMEP